MMYLKWLNWQRVLILSLCTVGCMALSALPEECDFPFEYKGDLHFGCMKFSKRYFCINGKKWVKCDPSAVNVKINDISGAVSKASAGRGAASEVPVQSATGDIRINEIMPRGENESPDWIELHNTGSKAVNLMGLEVNDEKAKDTFVFSGAPDCKVVIPPLGYVILFSKVENGTESCVTLPFEFGKSDSVSLSYKGKLIDEVSWKKDEIPKGASFGRPQDSSSTFEVLKTPTALKKNDIELGHGPYGLNYFRGETIAQSSGTMNNMRSGLPIAVIQTFSNKPIPNYPKVRAKLWISGCSGNPTVPKNYQNTTVKNLENTVCTLSDQPMLDADIGIEVRGRSSQKFPKKQYSFELWTSGARSQSAISEGGIDAEDFEYPLVGMPENADWTLNGDYIDRSLMRNPIAMQIWTDFGYWAPRQAFVELFLWDPDQQASRSDSYYYELKHSPLRFATNYKGIYAIRENIKRSAGRMDLPKLKTNNLFVREGAYILEFRSVEHENLFRNEEPSEPSIMDTGATRIYFKYPKMPQMTDRQFASSYIKGFEKVLFDDDKWQNERNGYRMWIDVQSFIDYFFHTEITKNLDGYISSVYMSLQRNGTLAAGPPWDFDLAFGNSAGWNGYYKDWTRWTFNGPNQNKFSRLVQWYKRMLEDPVFKDMLGKRWAELRSGPLTNEKIKSNIARNRALLRPGVSRNSMKWPLNQISTGDNRIPMVGSQGNWVAEAKVLTEWIENRMLWMDEELGKYMNGSTMAVEREERSRDRDEVVRFPLLAGIREEIQAFYRGWG